MLKRIYRGFCRNVIAWIALAVALGGTSYAAAGLPSNSVGTRQLRNGAVTDSKIRRHTLTAGSFNPDAFRTVELALQFPVGPGCPPRGSCGMPSGSQSLSLHCPSAMVAIGGGYSIPPVRQDVEVPTRSAPTSHGHAWAVTLTVPHPQATGGNTPPGTIYVVCARLG